MTFPLTSRPKESLWQAAAKQILGTAAVEVQGLALCDVLNAAPRDATGGTWSVTEGEAICVVLGDALVAAMGTMGAALCVTKGDTQGAALDALGVAH